MQQWNAPPLLSAGYVQGHWPLGNTTLEMWVVSAHRGGQRSPLTNLSGDRLLQPVELMAVV